MGIKNKEVLVIDDEPTTRILITKILENVGMTVYEAANIPEALETLTKRSPHLIITDLMMPKITGFTLLEYKKKIPALKALPIVVLSALGDKKSIMKAISLGASDYLVKPLNATLLIRKVRKALMDEGYKEYVFPDGAESLVELKIPCTITNIGETGFLLECPLKISQETYLDISSKLFAEIEATDLKMKTTNRIGRLNSESGQFYNNIIFMGMTEKTAGKIRSYINAKKKGNKT